MPDPETRFGGLVELTAQELRAVQDILKRFPDAKVFQEIQTGAHAPVRFRLAGPKDPAKQQEIMTAIERAGVCKWAPRLERAATYAGSGCPKCGTSGKCVPIIFGPASPKNDEAAARGEAILIHCKRGDGDDPTHGCLVCGEKWRRP